MTWAWDIVRSLFWGIVEASLWLTDTVYSITSSVLKLDVGQQTILWGWWSVLMFSIALFVLIRVGSMTLKLFLDEDYRDKMGSKTILFRIIPVVLAMGLAPIGIKYVTSAGTIAVSNISIFVGGDPKITPSTLLLSNVINEKKGNTVVEYKLDDIEINKKSTVDGKTYEYFDNFSEIVIMLVMAIIAVAGFLLNAIQIAKRFYSIGVKILIAPIPISGLINPDDDSFGVWVKMIVADVLSNFIQYLLLFFVLMITSSQQVRTAVGTWGIIILFIGGILTVLTGVPELARLIGGDTSTGSVMQQVASVRHATAGFGSAVGGALGGAAGSLAGVAGLGAAASAVIGGKALGGESFGVMSKALGATGAASNGFKGATSKASNFSSGRSVNEEPQATYSTSSASDESSSTDYGYQSYAKEGTFAKKVAEYGYENTGKRATIARMASVGGRHMYASSVNRINQSAPMKLAQRVRNLNQVPSGYQTERDE